MSEKRSERLRQRFQRRQQRINDNEERMPGWACGIDACSFTSETVEELITHQSRDHSYHTCKVCQRDLPDGFIAIYHALEEHNRAEYVKAYDASPDDVRQRERVVEEISRQIDVPAFLQRLDVDYRTLNPQ